MKKGLFITVLCFVLIMSSFSFATTVISSKVNNHTGSHEDFDIHECDQETNVTLNNDLTVVPLEVWYHNCHPEQEHRSCHLFKWIHINCECISYEYKCCCGKVMDYIVFPCPDHGFN